MPCSPAPAPLASAVGDEAVAGFIPGPPDTSPVLRGPGPAGPGRAGTLTLAAWMRGHSDTPGAPRSARQAGLAEPDLDTHVRLVRAQSGPAGPHEMPAWTDLLTRTGLLGGLKEAAVALPGLSLRAGLAWWFLSALSGREFAWPVGEHRLPPALVTWMSGGTPDRVGRATVGRTWAALEDPDGSGGRPALVGLAERGWVLAAAGISRAEAETDAAAGTLDWTGAEAVGALREFPFPRTP